MSEANPNELTLPMIPADGGQAHAARYRLGLAMLCTMLADMAEDVGPVKVEMLHDLAAGIVLGTESGLKLINRHAARMADITIEMSTEEEGGSDD